MNMIVIEVYGKGALIGRYGFYVVPRVGEQVRVPGFATPLTVQGVTHSADAKNDNVPPPFIQILVA
jgi:hypothetical protein